jgi:hypothetical protein
MPEEERKSRDEWFTITPSPWDEIALMDYAGDRSYASMINDMVVKAEVSQHPVLEDKLLQALATPGITEAGVLFICRMLALLGSAKCVPALIPFLSDSRTSDLARITLDAIDAPEVADAYRLALNQVSGSAKAGLIGSIAMRGDVRAVDELVAIALNASESVEVRAAAERAAEKLSAKP